MFSSNEEVRLQNGRNRDGCDGFLSRTEMNAAGDTLLIANVEEDVTL